MVELVQIDVDDGHSQHLLEWKRAQKIVNDLVFHEVVDLHEMLEVDVLKGDVRKQRHIHDLLLVGFDGRELGFDGASHYLSFVVQCLH